MNTFLTQLLFYLHETIPALVVGFLLSGIIHELVPSDIIERHLGKKGIVPILWATLIGTILPICCIGSLPVALAFYRKGSKPGPVFSFLVATPATSITALFVSYRLLGLAFTIYIFFTVIVIGIIVGIIANTLNIRPRINQEEVCTHCGHIKSGHTHGKDLKSRIKAVLKFGFVDMLKDIGPQIIIGLVLAALIVSFAPIGEWIKNYLTGFFSYIYALIFGLVMYICSTATVPLVDALIKQGLAQGAGMVLLIAGPVTSYSTILVLAKEFGIKVLIIYLAAISILALISGYAFSLFPL